VSAGGQHPPPRVLPTAQKIALRPMIRNDEGPTLQPLLSEFDMAA
jgi:hypothetical protein